MLNGWFTTYYVDVGGGSIKVIESGNGSLTLDVAATDAEVNVLRSLVDGSPFRIREGVNNSISLPAVEAVEVALKDSFDSLILDMGFPAPRNNGETFLVRIYEPEDSWNGLAWEFCIDLNAEFLRTNPPSLRALSLSAPSPAVRATVAHEMFHAIQFTYRPSLFSWNYGWWVWEGVAR
ncbi:MAG: hypothetical protein CMP28_13715, partial [Roseibacillus sp.]|nr:hypothetical protein [Roseibacillus sp.]